MSIEDRLRRELHDTAEQLIVRPDDYERVVRIGKRRKLITTLTGAAASLVVAVAGVIALSTLRPDPNPPLGSSTSTPPAPTTSTTSLPPQPGAWETAGVAVASSAGITTYGLDGTITAELTSDPWYETVSWALADGAGGLVFVHDITPLPWEQGSIMWLPAGASQPRPLVAPGPGELMVPLEMIDGTLTLLYRYDHRGGSELRTLDLLGPSTNPFLEVGPYFFDAAADSDVLAVVSGDPCLQVNFYLISGGGPIDVGFGDQCLPPLTAVAMAGGFLYTLEDGDSGRQLAVRHLGTGELVDAIDAGDAWSLEVA
ncbi:MAG TPA: hypothetical protein VJR05_14230, partial [Acidimicrobiia bacterium]|nr:hypothetical protein [Acidimicrobiia bacterium]